MFCVFLFFIFFRCVLYTWIRGCFRSFLGVIRLVLNDVCGVIFCVLKYLGCMNFKVKSKNYLKVSKIQEIFMKGDEYFRVSMCVWVRFFFSVGIRSGCVVEKELWGRCRGQVLIFLQLFGFRGVSIRVKLLVFLGESVVIRLWSVE